MTIDEAIKDIKENIQPSVGGLSLEMAIQTLEEIEEYRAIGTVEELQSMKEKNDTLRALYEDARKEGNHLITKERAKVIDEFVTIMEEWNDNIKSIRNEDAFFTIENIRKVAEQMKGSK